MINICLTTQQLRWQAPQGTVRSWPVSTSAKGAGQQVGSEQTPLGHHRIKACIGTGMQEGAVFVGRRPTGEIYSPQLALHHPGRDWILTRILWLSGCESGFNRGGDVDTMRRFIYIHGTPDSEAMGVPASHGCIRMRNRDLIELFELVEPGCPVFIHQ